MLTNSKCNITSGSAILEKALLFTIVAHAAAMASMLHSPRALFGLSLGNAMAFVLLMIWLFAVTDRVLRLRRPDTPWGRFAPSRLFR